MQSSKKRFLAADYPSPNPARGAKMSVLVILAAGGALLLIVALILLQILGG